MIKITLNGDSLEIKADMTVRQLLEHLELPTEKIAVERNLEIVSKSTYDEVTIGDGDTLEIVHFIGGGIK